ncbi:hypothetical protein ACIOJE_36625 [Kitasatospora sp. NPDC087861]|uniref:hypothetical protein n=1 Tax=Kitasatospora sp. NPDC087861 TaxID=3364070 RepID=UPI00380C7813
MLTPVGHILWTAIIGGVLFRERRGGRFRFTAPVIVTYLGVSLLHALWDSMNGIAVWLVARTTASEWQRALFALGHMPDPTTEQVQPVHLLRHGRADHGLLGRAALAATAGPARARGADPGPAPGLPGLSRSAAYALLSGAPARRAPHPPLRGIPQRGTVSAE